MKFIGVAAFGFCIAMASSALAAPYPAYNTVRRAAEALGMLRGAGAGETLKALNRLEFTATGALSERAASGAWTDARTARYFAQVDYFLPAIRLDVDWPAAAGIERRIIVANKAEAWTESGQPGMNARPSTARADELIRQVWITPHGLVRAAIDLEGKGVTASVRAGKTVLTVPVQGAPARVTLDRDFRPAQMEMQITDAFGTHRLQVDYSGYQDFDHYGIFFPTRITHRIDDRVVLDLTVQEFHMNPYAIFPNPATLAARP